MRMNNVFPYFAVGKTAASQAGIICECDNNNPMITVFIITLVHL